MKMYVVYHHFFGLLIINLKLNNINAVKQVMKETILLHRTWKTANGTI